MSSLLNFLGMIIVALISLTGIVIQNRSHTKLMKQDELIENIDNKIDFLRTECKNDDIAINRKMDNSRKNSLKRFLVTELTKIKQEEYVPTDYQKQMLAEAKDEYNAVGGNSYVDTMYDELKDSKLL